MIKFIDKKRTYIEDSVKLEEGVTIYPDVYIEGKTIIKSGTVIYPYTYIINSEIDNNCKIYSSHIFDSKIGKNNIIGPYTHIRKNTITNEDCKIGSFTETKNLTLGNKSKIPHLSYIGDSKIGNEVNIGCGTITANYDGAEKHQTIIKDSVFVGCNTTLVAPVKIENHAFIAAGSTITDDVPSKSLSIARQRQINKENYIK